MLSIRGASQAGNRILVMAFRFLGRYEESGLGLRHGWVWRVAPGRIVI